MSMPAPAMQRPVAEQPVEVRTRFMTRVYAHLMVAIAAFIAVTFLLFEWGVAETIADIVFGGANWLIILGGFMLVSWMANSMAIRATTPTGQYGGFALLVVANSLLFAAPLYVAAAVPELEGTITLAAQISLVAFAVLSVIAVRSSKDFTFLRPLLLWGGILALVAIVGSVLFGMTLGLWFPLAMIAFAGGAILYDTQVIYRSYPPDKEVAAAMSLFASIALLFWYVLQLLMRR
ncbi:MAG: Bax inhibitor-1/YccA family protein [Nitriliruptoraceae bacterium]|nr:Bax inhibitor-1/YccA family protein [Nitriliruptoraceae bacterium]